MERRWMQRLFYFYRLNLSIIEGSFISLDRPLMNSDGTE